MLVICKTLGFMKLQNKKLQGERETKTLCKIYEMHTLNELYGARESWIFSFFLQQFYHSEEYNIVYSRLHGNNFLCKLIWSLILTDIARLTPYLWSKSWNKGSNMAESSGRF